jgi:hypothetical protein
LGLERNEVCTLNELLAVPGVQSLEVEKTAHKFV